MQLIVSDAILYLTTKTKGVKEMSGLEEPREDIYKEQLMHLVDEFVARIKAGTSDSEHFLTISEIEQMWSELRGNTSNLYSDILEDALSQVNEAELIRKKKQNI